MSVQELVENYGSPLFVLDVQKLRLNYEQLKDIMLSRWSKTVIAYSYKANYLPILCKNLCTLGAWAEVASGTEYSYARRIGVREDKIILNGPGKSLSELEMVLSNGIGLLIIDSISELEKVASISKTLPGFVNVGIRVSPKLPIGITTRFGMEMGANDSAVKACRLIGKQRNLRLTAVHCHLGTYVEEPSMYSAMLSQIAKFLQKLKKQTGVTVKTIDIGGGFPSFHERPINSEKVIHKDWGPYADAVSGSLAEITKSVGYAPSLIIEAGRSIAGDAFSILATVLALKKSKRLGTWIVCDAGTNILPSCSIFRPEINNTTRRGKKRVYNVSGPLCSPNDVIAIECELDEVIEGDILEIKGVGAYTLSCSSRFIYNRPSIISIDKDAITLVRKAETLDEWAGQY